MLIMIYNTHDSLTLYFIVVYYLIIEVYLNIAVKRYETI